jgi:hypothetical protein
MAAAETARLFGNGPALIAMLAKSTRKYLETLASVPHVRVSSITHRETIRMTKTMIGGDASLMAEW